MDKYILQDGVPVPEPDIRKWGKWLENDDNKRVAYIEILDDNGHVEISTVFLGIDHSFGGGQPVLFETMIFGGEHDQYQERYHTLEEAMAGHERAVELVKGSK